MSKIDNHDVHQRDVMDARGKSAKKNHASCKRGPPVNLAPFFVLSDSDFHLIFSGDVSQIANTMVACGLR